MKQVLVALSLLSLVAACGGLGNSANSSAGSANSSAGSAGSAASAGSAGSANSSASSWPFGRRAEVTTQTQTDIATQVAGGRTLIASLTDAQFERTRDGGIVRATGVAPRQGYYDAILFSPTELAPDENGVLTLEFRAQEPMFSTPVLTEWSRTITTGIFLSNKKLAAARQIRVVGRNTQISLRR